MIGVATAMILTGIVRKAQAAKTSGTGQSRGITWNPGSNKLAQSTGPVSAAGGVRPENRSVIGTTVAPRQTSWGRVGAKAGR